MCCELLFAGWLEVRDVVLPKLQELCKKQGTARFDVTTMIYFFEQRLPLAVLGYSAFLREAGAKAPPGKVPDDNAWLYIMCNVAVSTTISQRKNYPTSCMEYVDRLLYWKRANIKLYEHVKEGQSFINEDKVTHTPKAPAQTYGAPLGPAGPGSGPARLARARPAVQRCSRKSLLASL